MNRSAAPTGLPASVAWVVLFVAALGHLPAVGFDFAGADFDGLARAAGTAGDQTWPLHPWSQWVLWALLWPVLGLQPVGYHVVALVAFALLAWTTARVAHRLGAGTAGAALAGLAMGIGPCAWLAVGWVSGWSELWSMLFVAAALDLWLDRRPGPRPLFAAALAALALASAPSGAVAVLLLAGAEFTFDPAPSGPTRRARRMLLVVLAVLTVMSVGWALASQMVQPVTTGPRETLHLVHHFADAVWPLPAPLRGSLGLVLGGFVIVASAAASVIRFRSGDPRFVFCTGMAVLTVLAGGLALGTTLPLHGLGAKVAVTWILALAVGPWIERRLAKRTSAMRGTVLASAALAAILAVGWGVHGTTRARGADGRLVNPILHMTSITADARQQVRAMRRAPRPDGAPEQVLVLQAARVVLPEGLDLPADSQVILRSPVHTALRGELGLGMLLGPQAEAHWVTHFDDAHLDAFVFLDVADDRLRVLGPVENARIYSALIAIAAGQYSRGRHDLWHVIQMQGARVRFAFDPDALPIEPEELDAEAAGFAHYLVAREEPSALRVLRLFEQIYEEIRGEELIRDFDRPIRAPRHDR
jgi:hypothetical protein